MSGNSITDLRFACRQLLKNPGFTAVAVVTLAIGIGANTALFSVLHAILLRPLPFKEPDRLVMLWESNPRLDMQAEQVMPASVIEWRKQSQTLETIGYLANDSPGTRNFLLNSDGELHRLRARFASSGFFEALGVRPLLGRTFREDEDQSGPEGVAVLSHATWQLRFGGREDAIGQTIAVDGVRGRRCTVIGVMPPRFRFPHDAEMWFSFSAHPWHTQQRLVHDLWVVARLKSEASLDEARMEMNNIQARLAQAHPEVFQMATHAEVVPLLEQLIGPHTRGALLVLFGAVGFVLLIACANVANLLLARAVARQKEMAVRAALGATRVQVIRQLLTESVALAVLGGGFGLLLGWSALQLLPALSFEISTGVKDFRMSRFGEVSLDPVVLGFTLAATLLTSLLFGAVPALHASRTDLNLSLKDAGRGSAGSGLGAERARRLLLVFEMATALVLLIGAGLLLQSLIQTLRIEPGFQPKNALVAHIDPLIARQTYSGSTQDITRQILDQARAVPGVKAAGAAGALSLENSGYQMVFEAEGRGAPSGSGAQVIDGRIVTAGYCQALGIPILKGRDFTERDDTNSLSVALLNQAAVRKFFPNEDPIGQRVYMGHPAYPLHRDENAYEIAGIVGDVRDYSFHREVRPEAFLHYRQRRPNLWGGSDIVLPMVFRTDGDPMSAVPALRAAIEGPNPKGRVIGQIELLEDMLEQSAGDQKLRAILLGVFALTALVLAAVGLYGIMAYSVSQRTQEMGVRLALGADRMDLMKLILGQGLRLALAGVAIGLLAGFAFTRLLANLLFGISANDPVTFLSIPLFLLLVALAACLIPARRAANTEPMKALRCE